MPLGLQDIERLVFYLPLGPATGGEFNDRVTADIEIGDEAVAVGHLPAGVAYFDHQPVDRDRLGITPQRHAGQPLIPVSDPLPAAPDRLRPLVRYETGAKIFDRLV